MHMSLHCCSLFGLIGVREASSGCGKGEGPEQITRAGHPECR